MSSVVLHQWEISPFCQKAARMLRFKGIDFETINYNGILGAKVPLLSKVGKVPVVDIHQQRIQDSTRIARYLDEAFPDQALLYPKDPMQKRWLNYGKIGLMNLYISMKFIYVSMILRR